MRNDWQTIERSELLRTRFLAVRVREVLARMLIACARSADDPLLAEAERLARWFDREATVWPRWLAAYVRAAIAHRRGRTDQSLPLLERAERAALAIDMTLHAAALRRRRGTLLGGTAGAALVAGGDDVLRIRGIRAPEKYAEMLVPFGG